MNDLIIKIKKNTRQVILDQMASLGNDHENLQEKMIFQFDTFVNGQARLEYEINDVKNYLILNKEEETYTIPVQNVLTIYQDDEEKAGKIQFQLVITEGTEEENIPVFKSNIFYLRVRPSINAVTEAPEGYDLWIEQANAKLNAIDEALTEVDNLDIDANKVGKITSIVITKKDGTQKTINVEDGVGLEYLWQGTSLGIKREDEQEYVFVNLKGDKGEKGEAGAIKMIIVNELPETGADDTIYLVPAEDTETGNNYDEYVYVDNAWEKLGGIQVQVDLTDYVKNTDYATSSTGGVIKSSDYYGTVVSASSGILYGYNLSYQQYQQKVDQFFVTKGTLENVITGKNLETADNKVISISSSSTDTEYPSAKCVYDMIGNVETILETLTVGGGVA